MGRVRGVSPPTRGWCPWTHHGGVLGGLAGGFPAHAGMDRCARRSRLGRYGFPRPRGDGPLGTLAPIANPGFPRPRGDGPARLPVACFAAPVSPPTRGWTMVPPSCAVPCRRFPRPRGDGPAIALMARAPLSVSPPTRGWTVKKAELYDYGTLRLRDGFPRPRGDGPSARMARASRTSFLVSPPTRGWTQRLHRAGPSGSGFPAHAGMDPNTRAPDSGLITGFPAHAGMDRGHTRS